MSRTEYDVCLVISSESVKLSELASRIGTPPSRGSHSAGDPHRIKSRGQWRSTVWQLCSRLPRTATVAEQAADILEQMAPESVLRDGALPADAHVYISIGVFSNSQVPTLELTRACLRIADDYRAAVEIRFYSPDME